MYIDIEGIIRGFKIFAIILVIILGLITYIDFGDDINNKISQIGLKQGSGTVIIMVGSSNEVLTRSEGPFKPVTGMYLIYIFIIFFGTWFEIERIRSLGLDKQEKTWK